MPVDFSRFQLGTNYGPLSQALQHGFDQRLQNQQFQQKLAAEQDMLNQKLLADEQLRRQNVDNGFAPSNYFDPQVYIEPESKRPFRIMFSRDNNTGVLVKEKIFIDEVGGTTASIDGAMPKTVDVMQGTTGEGGMRNAAPLQIWSAAREVQQNKPQTEAEVLAATNLQKSKDAGMVGQALYQEEVGKSTGAEQAKTTGEQERAAIPQAQQFVKDIATEDKNLIGQERSLSNLEKIFTTLPSGKINTLLARLGQYTGGKSFGEMSPAEYQVALSKINKDAGIEINSADGTQTNMDYQIALLRNVQPENTQEANLAILKSARQSINADRNNLLAKQKALEVYNKIDDPKIRASISPWEERVWRNYVDDVDAPKKDNSAKTQQPKKTQNNIEKEIEKVVDSAVNTKGDFTSRAEALRKAMGGK